MIRWTARAEERVVDQFQQQPCGVIRSRIASQHPSHVRSFLSSNGLALSSAVLASAFALIACGGDTPSTRRNGAGQQGGGATTGASGFTGAGSQAGTNGFDNGLPVPTAGSGAGIGGAGMLPAGASGGDECARANVHTSRNTPTILFVVDGSGSMCETFGGSSRWNSLRAALLDPTSGLIHRLQQTVEFGMLLYDGTIDGFLALTAIGGSPSPACAGMYVAEKAMGECPQLISVPPAINNAAAIDMAFPQRELGGSTPTDRAMNSAVDQLLALRSNAPDTMIKPQYIILATDGQPNDICVGGLGGDGMAQKAGVIAAVDRGAAMGIKTFVVSLAGGDAGLEAHLAEVAQHGEPLNTMAHTFSPATPDELVAALAALVGGAVGCDIILNGMVTQGQECRGTVEMSGVVLPCCQGMSCGGVSTPTPNGWVLKDPMTISLVGETCTNFLTTTEASLSAGFPCDVFRPD